MNEEETRKEAFWSQYFNQEGTAQKVRKISLSESFTQDHEPSQHKMFEHMFEESEIEELPDMKDKICFTLSASIGSEQVRFRNKDICVWNVHSDIHKRSKDDIKEEQRTQGEQKLDDKKREEMINEEEEVDECFEDILSQSMNQEEVNIILKNLQESHQKNTSIKRRWWSKDEIKALVYAVKKNQRKISSIHKLTLKFWNEVSEMVPGRTPEQCSVKWKAMKEKKHEKNSWTKNASTLLEEAAIHVGEAKWKEMSEYLLKFGVRKTSKQCRERWINVLRPNLRKASWTASEDSMLIEMVDRIGNKWADIAKVIGGRTEGHLKNRYVGLMRKEKSVYMEEIIDGTHRAFTPEFIKLNTEEVEKAIFKRLVEKQRNRLSSCSLGSYFDLYSSSRSEFEVPSETEKRLPLTMNTLGALPLDDKIIDINK